MSIDNIFSANIGVLQEIKCGATTEPEGDIRVSHIHIQKCVSTKRNHGVLQGVKYGAATEGLGDKTGYGWIRVDAGLREKLVGLKENKIYIIKGSSP